jgi:hypothetical protein
MDSGPDIRWIWVRFPTGKKLFLNSVQLLQGHSQPVILCVPEAVSPGVKLQGVKLTTHHSTAEFKNYDDVVLSEAQTTLPFFNRHSNITIAK